MSFNLSLFCECMINLIFCFCYSLIVCFVLLSFVCLFLPVTIDFASDVREL